MKQKKNLIHVSQYGKDIFISVYIMFHSSQEVLLENMINFNRNKPNIPKSTLRIH